MKYIAIIIFRGKFHFKFNNDKQTRCRKINIVEAGTLISYGKEPLIIIIYRLLLPG